MNAYHISVFGLISVGYRRAVWCLGVVVTGRSYLDGKDIGRTMTWNTKSMSIQSKAN